MGHPIAFHLDAINEVQNYEQVSREGIWRLPRDGVQDWLILTNQSGFPMDLTLSLSDSAGKVSRTASQITVTALNQTGGPSESSQVSRSTPAIIKTHLVGSEMDIIFAEDADLGAGGEHVMTIRMLRPFGDNYKCVFAGSYYDKFLFVQDSKTIGFQPFVA
jgi:hypothetical protein